MPNTNTLLKAANSNSRGRAAILATSDGGYVRGTGGPPPFSENKRNKILIKGTNDKLSAISAAQERKWIYVGNIGSECTMEMVRSHMEANRINVLSCEKLPTKQDHISSFKISIPAHHRENAFNSEIWPRDVIVKPFVFPGADRGRYGKRNFQKTNFQKRLQQQQQN